MELGIFGAYFVAGVSYFLTIQIAYEFMNYTGWSLVMLCLIDRKN